MQEYCAATEICLPKAEVSRNPSFQNKNLSPFVALVTNNYYMGKINTRETNLEGENKHLKKSTKCRKIHKSPLLIKQQVN